MNLFEKLHGNLVSKPRIVYPEGSDPRIIGGCSRLVREGKIEGILLGNPEEIKKSAEENSLDLEGIVIKDYLNDGEMEAMVDAFVDLRKGKNTKDQAMEMLKSPNYYGTMMVKLAKADAMIAGAVSSTGDTIIPALQIIKAKPGDSRISGSMVMFGPNGERYIFADIAINISLDSEGLAELAKQSAETARIFDLDPKVAMLSFSTKGSAKSEETEKVVRAVEITQEKYPDLVIDGELQFDAAISPSVGKRKAPGSPVAGQANVFIFPDLEAGNIGYKIAQRLGGYEAIGPILQGLAAPIADLSRGCNEEDVYKLSIVTGLQAQDLNK